MSEPARPRGTYEALLALPDGVLGQIIGGELHATPRPGSDHTNAASVLGMDLGPFHGRGGGGSPGDPGGWWILDVPELHLGDDVLVPDLAGWRRARMPRRPRDPFFTICPDWVCEVISPTTIVIDRVKKKRIYAREGVTHLWIVDPAAQTLEVHRRAGDFWQEIASFDGDCAVRAEPFESIEIMIGRWWEE